MEAKIKEGCYRKKVWIAGGNATMLVQTWLNFKKKKWENSQEIKSFYMASNKVFFSYILLKYNT